MASTINGLIRMPKRKLSVDSYLVRKMSGYVKRLQYDLCVIGGGPAGAVTSGTMVHRSCALYIPILCLTQIQITVYEERSCLLLINTNYPRADSG
jgi:hypothetical protein